MKKFLLVLVTVFGVLSCSQSKKVAAWGDTGDGHYVNPVLVADYSDPDVIRYGDKYYMVASDFHFMGMQVLESDDLVNWRIISQIYDRLDLPGWETMEHYSGGSWAPSIRWHDGKFYVYFCTPDEGLFMSQADSPEGPWSPLHTVKAIARWEDPCPFWDDDGTAYLGHSLKGAGPIIIHRMSPDGKELLDDGVTVYEGITAEGTKIHKWNGWYYLSIPEGGVRNGWQTVLRSKSIYGPYDRKVVLETGSTSVNGPHQGAIVDTPYGEWWFVHFQQLGALGRVVHLQPMHWEDGWPVMGEDYDGNGQGEEKARHGEKEYQEGTPGFFRQVQWDAARAAVAVQPQSGGRRLVADWGRTGYRRAQGGFIRSCEKYSVAEAHGLQGLIYGLPGHVAIRRRPESGARVHGKGELLHRRPPGHRRPGTILRKGRGNTCYRAN